MTNGSFRFARPILAIALVGFIAAGCDDDDDDDDVVFADPTQGSLQVFATDAPPELDRLNAVLLSIQRIEAIGGVTTSTVPIFDSNISGIQQVDLVPLRAGNRALLTSSSIPVGSYDRIRVFFSDIEVRYQTPAGLETFSTNNGNLTFGGEQENGVDFVELALPEAVVVDSLENEQVLLDFDLAESLDVVGPTDDPTSITFTPVGRARDITNESGSLAGVVTTDAGTATTADDTPVNNASVVLRQNGEVVATTKTDAGGVYVIEGLDAGTYLLVVTDPGDTTRTIETNTTVNTSQRTTADVLLTETTTATSAN